MERTETKVFSAIKDSYSKLTSAERTAADFFLKNTEEMDFSSKAIAAKLYVSEASLSRFAQKCGFKGYREFIYEYERPFTEDSRFSSFDFSTKKVLSSYQTLLDKSYELVNEHQLWNISCILRDSRCVYIYGMGSSGIAARELKLRFMRTGMLVEAITDTHMIKMNAALVDSSMTVIAITLSGRTDEIISAAKLAKKSGAKLIVMTADASGELKKIADEVLQVASLDELSLGTQVSPQFPILVMTDIFFAYYFGNDECRNRYKFKLTYDALGEETEHVK